jgi:hypothetical protein
VTTGDVRVYLIGYTICIIGCHICQDIFDRINIMYYELPYVYKGVLLLLYSIYIGRKTQCNTSQNNKLRNKNWKFVLLYDYKPLPSTLRNRFVPIKSGPCAKFSQQPRASMETEASQVNRDYSLSSRTRWPRHATVRR